MKKPNLLDLGGTLKPKTKKSIEEMMAEANDGGFDCTEKMQFELPRKSIVRQKKD